MNGMNSTQFDHAHLGFDARVLTFDQKTFDLVARAAFFSFESSGQSIFEDFIYIFKLAHLAV